MSEHVCYRRACQAPDAKWWNTSTRQYYCDSCAAKINAYSPGLCVPFKAYVQAGGGGYGACVFIPYAHVTPSIAGYLERTCKWGGPDKDTGKCQGWEVRDDVPGHRPMQELMHYLEGYGFKVEKVGIGNHGEVWK